MHAAGSGRLASGGACAKRRQRGAIAVMFAASLLAILGFMGLALDLSMVYNRKVEMQNLANTVALAAAIELNGTPAGVTAALQRAGERFVVLPGTVVGGMSYQYSTRTMAWSSEAIAFGPTPAGPWVDAGTAQTHPAALLFARVDTSGLDTAYGEVTTSFIRVVAPDNTIVATGARAIAGRSAIKVVPMGICAMRPEAARNHAGELEEYGFRRGVAYDLMQLNPDATAAGATFMIDPFVAPGTPGAGPAASTDAVRPFICTGTMAMSKVTGGDVAVTPDFPLTALFAAFNTRFDSYASPCRADTAPPDTNIKEYTYNDGSAPWMDATPSGQSAAQSLADGKRWTVAGPDPTPAGTTAPMYGPLWAYAKPARFSAYVAGSLEPTAGYSTFGTGDWATLYNPGNPKPKSYPSSTPYAQTSATYFSRPKRPGLRGRRVLNIALLACPVSGNRATILAVGKFFMPVKATSDLLIGEFAGITAEQSLGTQVKIYP